MKIILIILFLFLSINPQIDKILFIGDSMTAYQGGWQHQLSKKLGVSYTNLSVPGKRTLWMKETLESHLIKNRDYKVCFIYGGINDGFSYVKIESVLINVQNMVDLCNKNNIKPVVILGYRPDVVMINTKPNYAKLEWHRNRYIEIQGLLQTKLKNCEIIPIDQTITRRDSDDGVHFIASGHKKFSEWVFNNLTKY